MTQVEPFPTRIAVHPDLYRALVQMQIDFYATQGNVGDYWSLLAERSVAAAFCPLPDPLDGIVDRWAKTDAKGEAREDAADDAEGDLFR